MSKISIIGYGNMAKAMIGGLSSDKTFSLRATAPSLPIQLNPSMLQTHPDNTTFLADADLIILAVKPKQMSTVLAELSPHLPEGKAMISIAAGLSLSWLASHCRNPEYAIIRAMPNICSEIKSSVTPMIASHTTSVAQEQLADRVFKSIGLTHWVTEEEMLDKLTGLLGSGPAYVYYFMEALEQAAKELGLDDKLAAHFSQYMASSSLHLAAETGISFTALKKSVTSPGGTTEAALNVLHKTQLTDRMCEALHAAYQQAQALKQT